MSQDTSDDGGGNDDETKCQLQMAYNTLAIATHNRYLTLSIGTRNKPISKMKHINLVTPTDSNIPSNTIRLAGIPNKADTTNDHKVCINVDTVDEMVPKIGVGIIEIDIDGDNTDAEAINDDNKIPGLDKNGVTASIVWDSEPDPEHICRLPDSELIRQTVYGPDVTPFPLAYVGNALGTIFSNKIKTLTPGIWLMDEVVDFINGLLNLKCTEACLLQDADQQSYFVFPSKFMAHLLNKGGDVGGGEYTFENVVRYTYSKKRH